MLNHRSLRELIFLAVLTSASDGVQNKRQFRYLVLTGIYSFVAKITDVLERELPNLQDRNKVISSAQKSVNVILPIGFSMWAPELKLWFAGQVCMKLVASGWRPPTDQEAAMFIQALYDVATTFNPGIAPSPEVVQRLQTLPQFIHEKTGMFLPSSPLKQNAL